MPAADVTHCCLVCRTALIPVFRAFCGRCFRIVPWDLRAEVMQAWRMRVRNQAAFQDKLIELKIWEVEYRGEYIERAQ